MDGAKNKLSDKNYSVKQCCYYLVRKRLLLNKECKHQNTRVA